jgi:hypothetical protein
MSIYTSYRAGHSKRRQQRQMIDIRLECVYLKNTRLVGALLSLCWRSFALLASFSATNFCYIASELTRLFATQPH